MLRAVRMVTFNVRNPDGEIKIVKIWNRDIIKVAEALKYAGYKIVKDSIKVSDTIVMGDTNIIRKAG